jgi:serine-type D-Ala-D-Ala carboxypeptidase (penicillin-binding protein 5/6)
MKTFIVLISMLAAFLITLAHPASAAVQVVSRSPYAGAIAIDAATGRVLFEDNADAPLYPASVTKLMVLLVLLDAIEEGRMNPAEPVTVTAEAAKIGGSQVYLKKNEVFPVNDLIYALMIESANDAAAALAIHYAGSKAAFVDLMNARAREIGMKDTIFRSVHGLPPGRGQLPDVSTARDIATLSREVLKKPGALRYTSTRRRPFRAHTGHPFMMTNHNKLLGRVEGCDGLKTGYFRAAGYSIAATATKSNKRVIAVVLGASHAKVRNAKAKEMLAKGLRELAAPAACAVPAAAHRSSR